MLKALPVAVGDGGKFGQIVLGLGQGKQRQAVLGAMGSQAFDSGGRFASRAANAASQSPPSPIAASKQVSMTC